jgi:hypothetical protein
MKKTLKIVLILLFLTICLSIRQENNQTPIINTNLNANTEPAASLSAENILLDVIANLEEEETEAAPPISIIEVEQVVDSFTPVIEDMTIAALLNAGDAIVGLGLHDLDAVYEKESEAADVSLAKTSLEENMEVTFLEETEATETIVSEDLSERDSEIMDDILTQEAIILSIGETITEFEEKMGESEEERQSELEVDFKAAPQELLSDIEESQQDEDVMEMVEQEMELEQQTFDDDLVVLYAEIVMSTDFAQEELKQDVEEYLDDSQDLKQDNIDKAADAIHDAADLMEAQIEEEAVALVAAENINFADTIDLHERETEEIFADMTLIYEIRANDIFTKINDLTAQLDQVIDLDAQQTLLINDILELANNAADLIIPE